MSRRYSLRKFEDDEFESEIFKDMEKKTQDENGASESENESVESESSENENLLVESGEEYDGEIVGARVEKSGQEEEDDSDEDDAPETVSFQSGKENALLKMRQVMKQIDSEKTALKTKRRKLDEQYKEQKKRKLEKLSNSKLPEDFFNDLPEKTNAEKSKPSKNKRVSSIADEEEGSLADTEEDFDVSKEDFIPLENNRLNGIEVSTVQSHQQKTMSSKCRAEDFRTARLSNVPRHTSKAYYAALEKKKALKKGLGKDFMIK